MIRTTKATQRVLDIFQGRSGAPRVEERYHDKNVHPQSGRGGVYSDLHVHRYRRICLLLSQWQEDVANFQECGYGNDC